MLIRNTVTNQILSVHKNTAEIILNADIFAIWLKQCMDHNRYVMSVKKDDYGQSMVYVDDVEVSRRSINRGEWVEIPDTKASRILYGLPDME